LLDGEAGFLPGCEATLEVKHGCIARGRERGLALPSARPDHAIESDTVRRIDFHDSLSHFIEWDVDGARDMTRGVLRRGPDIDYNGCFARGAPVVELGCADARGLTGLGFSGERTATKDGDEESECESNHVLSPLWTPNGPGFIGLHQSGTAAVTSLTLSILT
jgi:hypothetical protein